MVETAAVQTSGKYGATGRRKEATARATLFSGTGKITINKRPFENYFSKLNDQLTVKQPIEAVDLLGKLDIDVTVSGGGTCGQAAAVRHAVSRALVMYDEKLKKALRDKGFLSRDPRMKERKKYGQKGARKRFQFTKR